MPGKRPLPADSPVLAVISAVSALGLAVILVAASLPSEERILVYEGVEVSPAGQCETVVEDGETASVPCAEVGTYETRRSGWQVPTLVAAGVLTALAAVVLVALPRQVRERRRRREMADASDDRLDGPGER